MRAVHHTLPHIGKLYVLSDEDFVPSAEFHRIEPIRSLTDYSELVLNVLIIGET